MFWVPLARGSTVTRPVGSNLAPGWDGPATKKYLTRVDRYDDKLVVAVGGYDSAIQESFDCILQIIVLQKLQLVWLEKRGKQTTNDRFTSTQ